MVQASLQPDMHVMQDLCPTFAAGCHQCAGGYKSPGRRPLIVAVVLRAVVCQGSIAILPSRCASSKAASPGALPAGLLLLLRWRPEAASPACRRGPRSEGPIQGSFGLASLVQGYSTLSGSWRLGKALIAVVTTVSSLSTHALFFGQVLLNRQQTCASL